MSSRAQLMFSRHLLSAAQSVALNAALFCSHNHMFKSQIWLCLFFSQFISPHSLSIKFKLNKELTYKLLQTWVLSPMRAAHHSPALSFTLPPSHTPSSTHALEHRALCPWTLFVPFHLPRILSTCLNPTHPSS